MIWVQPNNVKNIFTKKAMHPAVFIRRNLKLVGHIYQRRFIGNSEAIRFGSILPNYAMTTQTFTLIIDNFLSIQLRQIPQPFQQRCYILSISTTNGELILIILVIPERKTNSFRNFDIDNLSPCRRWLTANLCILSFFMLLR